jgi:proteasome lid subunit RPN8/RPN11
MVNKTLSADILQQALPEIVAKGLSDAPYEAVGLLLPDGGVWHLANESPNTGQYMVTGAQLEIVVNQITRETPSFSFWDFIVWHTHPSGFIGPSQGDLKARRQGPLTHLAHLVIALPEGEAVYY